MFLPDPEYPWKWNKRLDGQPSEYLGFNTVGSGTILHREHLKHFCISASSSFSRDKAIVPLYSDYLENKSQVDFCGRMNPLISTVSDSYICSYLISSLPCDLRNVK